MYICEVSPIGGAWPDLVRVLQVLCDEWCLRVDKVDCVLDLVEEGLPRHGYALLQLLLLPTQLPVTHPDHLTQTSQSPVNICPVTQGQRVTAMKC